MKRKERIKRVFSKITIPQRIKKFFLERFFDFVAVVLIALLLVILASLIVRIIGNESHWLDDWLGTDQKSNAKYQTLRSLALLSAGLGGLLGLFISKRIKKFFLERFFDFAAVVLIAFLLVILASLIVRIIGNESHWLDDWLGTDQKSNAKYQTLRSLALLSAGLGGLLGLFISNRRAKAQAESVKEQAKSVDAQVKANENTTFHGAIKHLGDLSASVRLGGIYALYDLALSKPKKRLKNIIEILSAHVRATTQEEEYQKKYKKKPSDEISSLLKLLSNLNIKYLSENEEGKWYPLDLSNAYLCGVILQEVDFSHAIFTRSNFSCANLEESHFEDADLEESHFEGAFLYKSHFERADLKESCFEGANLLQSHFEGANLLQSHFEDATLTKSHFSCANFKESHFTGAKLERSHFRGATLTKSHFEGANLRESCFEGAKLQESRFEDAKLYVSYFEGANLSESHFEGAFLEESNFGSVILYGSHFEGAYLLESHFEGAYLLASHFEGFLGDLMCFSGDFRKRIKNRIGKKANIGNRMIFAGGITEDDIKALKKITEDTLPHFTDDDRRKEFKKDMNQAIGVLKIHQDKPTIREIPEDVKGSISLGELTEYRANEIIKNYDEIMKQYDKVIKKYEKIVEKCDKNDK